MFHQKMKTTELNRTGATIRCTQGLKISLSAVTQLSKPGSMQLQVMLLCAGEPGHAALSPSRKVLLQKHLPVYKKQWEDIFLSLPASAPILSFPFYSPGTLLASSLWSCLHSAVIQLWVWSQQVTEAH